MTFQIFSGLRKPVNAFMFVVKMFRVISHSGLRLKEATAVRGRENAA